MPISHLVQQERAVSLSVLEQMPQLQPVFSRRCDSDKPFLARSSSLIASKLTSSVHSTTFSSIFLVSPWHACFDLPELLLCVCEEAACLPFDCSLPFQSPTVDIVHSPGSPRLSAIAAACITTELSKYTLVQTIYTHSRALGSPMQLDSCSQQINRDE